MLLFSFFLRFSLSLSLSPTNSPDSARLAAVVGGSSPFFCLLSSWNPPLFSPTTTTQPLFFSVTTRAQQRTAAHGASDWFIQIGVGARSLWRRPPHLGQWRRASMDFCFSLTFFFLYSLSVLLQRSPSRPNPKCNQNAIKSRTAKFFFESFFTLSMSAWKQRKTNQRGNILQVNNSVFTTYQNPPTDDAVWAQLSCFQLSGTHFMKRWGNLNVLNVFSLCIYRSSFCVDGSLNDSRTFYPLTLQKGRGREDEKKNRWP